MGVGLQPQPLGFQRDSTAACKGVQQGRRVIIGGAQDLCLGSRQYLRVVGVFPLDQLFQNAKQPLPFGVLGFLGGVQLRVGRGVVHKAGPDHSSCRRQRTPCPPQMQRGRVPVPDGFFPRCFRIDRFQRKGNFDQLFRCCHYRFSPFGSGCCGFLSKELVQTVLMGRGRSLEGRTGILELLLSDTFLSSCNGMICCFSFMYLEFRAIRGRCSWNWRGTVSGRLPFNTVVFVAGKWMRRG